MCDRFKFLLVFLVFFSCSNEFFPENLYDYQVERLLSGGSSQVWDQVVSSESCQDSVRLIIELIASNSDDSVAVSHVIGGNLCNPDTSLLGNADASSFSDAIIFTDSLNFSTGDFWIIESISSKSLKVLNASETITYVNIQGS